MPIEITVPRLGWSMEEGTFIGWLKREGELVQAGEPLFTLESEKAAQDIEATDNGTLRFIPSSPAPGTIVKVGAVLGYLAAKNETVSSLMADQHGAAQAPKPAIAPTPVPLTSETGATTVRTIRGNRPIASPRARRRARELGIDFTRIRGTGRTGRIIEADIRAAAITMSARPKLSALRRGVAERTARSFAEVPHFYLHTEVEVTALLEFRETTLPEMERRTGIRLSLSDLLLRAQALALADTPVANVVWENNQLRALTTRDVGLVVAVGDGLLIPILRAADQGSLAELVQQRARLVEAARSQQLAPDATRGGATTLSNLGDTCVDEFAAVIPPPHSSILAVGRVALRPIVTDGALAVRPTLKLCLSVDHRVMDGVPAAQFLGNIVEHLLHPESLMGSSI